MMERNNKAIIVGAVIFIIVIIWIVLLVVLSALSKRNTTPLDVSVSKPTSPPFNKGGGFGGFFKQPTKVPSKAVQQGTKNNAANLPDNVNFLKKTTVAIDKNKLIGSIPIKTDSFQINFDKDKNEINILLYQPANVSEEKLNSYIAEHGLNGTDSVSSNYYVWNPISTSGSTNQNSGGSTSNQSNTNSNSQNENNSKATTSFLQFLYPNSDITTSQSQKSSTTTNIANQIEPDTFMVSNTNTIRPTQTASQKQSNSFNSSQDITPTPNTNVLGDIAKAILLSLNFNPPSVTPSVQTVPVPTASVIAPTSATSPNPTQSIAPSSSPLPSGLTGSADEKKSLAVLNTCRPPITPKHLVAISNGAAAVSYEEFQRVLTTRNSPAKNEGRAIYDLGIQYGIDPAFLLAFFLKESNVGTCGNGGNCISTRAKNIGNIICTSGWTGGCIPNPANKNTAFRVYNSWTQSAGDWYGHMRDSYIKKWGLVYIETIIPKYAPPFENDTCLYVKQITSWFDSGFRTIR
jgi:hypothetical protein